MDFKVLVDALIKGTPWAILIALVGAIWQTIYIYSRDKAHDKHAKLLYGLEREKLENQKELDKEKFESQRLLAEYEQRKWREQLSTQIILKQFDARLAEYTQLWAVVETAARHRFRENILTPELAKNAATNIRSWRYAKGGLLAEETTREAAYLFQTALWNFDGSNEAYQRIRDSRKLLRSALRADIGLGEDAQGNSIFDAAERRQKILAELSILRKDLS